MHELPDGQGWEADADVLHLNVPLSEHGVLVLIGDVSQSVTVNTADADPETVTFAKQEQ